jgi:hypothetical protein
MTIIASSADSASEKASKSDREWFARNPHRTYRVRRYIRDEFPRKDSDGIDLTEFTPWTVVKQIEPGRRLRQGFFVKSGIQPIDADWTLRPLFDCLVDCMPGLHGPGTPLGEAIGNAFLPPAHILRAKGGLQ